MIIVLKWKYNSRKDMLLDYMVNHDFDTQEDIAKGMGISKKTIQRNVSKLKNDGLLIIHRYKDNNFIYMVGDDAEKNWNKYEAYHIAKYRMYDSVVQEVRDEEVEELLGDLPLFDSEKKELSEDMGWKDSMGRLSNPSESMIINLSDRVELDIIIASRYGEEK